MATAGGARGSGPERAFAPELPAAGSVTLDPEESSHLVRSRRVRENEPVVLFDGRGTTRLGRLATADPRAAVVAIEGDYPARTPTRSVKIAASLPEGGRADRMVAVLAELGVAAFAPLVSERTAPKRRQVAAGRLARWQRLAREAAKVNGCGELLAIHAPIPLADAIRQPTVLLDPDPGAPRLLDAFTDGAWLLVGPEGGFTDAELAAAGSAGVPTARVGNLSLRTETAAVAAAAVLSD